MHLLASASAVMGRRATGTTDDVGSESGGIQGGAQGNPSVAGSAAGSAGGVAGGPGTNLLQIIETENTNAMTAIIREWKRLPLVVTNQHVPLLQVGQVSL